MQRTGIVLLGPFAVAVLSLGGLAALAWNGWPGTTGVSATMFCEAFRDGLIKQPANTWSNLGFVAVGLGIGVRAWRDLTRRVSLDRPNRMTRTLFYPTFLAALVVFLGPGSMAMHASTTAWGGKVDVLSMYLYVCFLPAYGAARLFDLSRRQFGTVYAVFAVPCVAVLLSGMDPSMLLFRGMVFASVASELAVWWQRPDLGGDRSWLLTGGGCFALGYAIWLPSHTGGPLCVPDSLLQGHAIWHLLCAAATGCFYLFFRSERRYVGPEVVPSSEFAVG